VVKNHDGSISTVRTISIGTDQGEVLIPTVVGNRVVSDEEAIREYQRTGKHLGIFGTPEDATSYAQSLHQQQERQYARPTAQPLSNGAAAVSAVYPNARITDNRRPANSALGRANPRSWHVRSGGAVDIAPIPGMSFDQYVGGLRKAGHTIIEARDEVNNPSSHATGPHWHVVLGKGR
jgi:hypothetical protein